MRYTVVERGVLLVALVAVVVAVAGIGLDAGGSAPSEDAADPAVARGVAPGDEPPPPAPEEPGGVAPGPVEDELEEEGPADPPGEGEATRIEPGETSPPQPGTYRYRETFDGDSSEMDLVVRSAGATGAGDHQIEEARQSEPEGPTMETHVLWTPEGKFIDRIVTSFGGEGSECDYEPDVRELQLPLGPGTEWSFEGECVQGDGAFRARQRFEGSYRVVGAERTEVGGRTVDVWAMEGTVTHTSSASGGDAPGAEGAEFRTEIASRDLFAPSVGLKVHSEGMSSFTDPRTGEEKEARMTRELLDLAPA